MQRTFHSSYKVKELQLRDIDNNVYTRNESHYNCSTNIISKRFVPAVLFDLVMRDRKVTTNVCV
jgi:hypothetical protein